MSITCKKSTSVCVDGNVELSKFLICCEFIKSKKSLFRLKGATTLAVFCRLRTRVSEGVTYVDVEHLRGRVLCDALIAIAVALDEAVALAYAKLQTDRKRRETERC